MRALVTRLLTVVALVLMVGTANTALAKSDVGSGSFGAGIQLGYPGNGLSFNYFLSQSTSLQIDATLWLNGDWTGFGGRVDFLWWQSPLASMSWADLMWYFGPGGNIFWNSWSGNKNSAHDDNYVGLGAEFPVGIGFRFTGAPIDLNLEAVPILHILGSGGTDIAFGIAGVLNARYYF